MAAIFVLCRAEFLLDTNHTETRDDIIVNCYSSNFLNIIKMQGFSRLKYIQLHTYVTACLIMSFNKSAKFITDYSCYKISVTKKNRLNSSVTRRGRMERSRPVRAIKYFVLILYNLRPCQDLCDIWGSESVKSSLYLPHTTCQKHRFHCFQNLSYLFRTPPHNLIRVLRFYNEIIKTFSDLIHRNVNTRRNNKTS